MTSLFTMANLQFLRCGIAFNDRFDDRSHAAVMDPPPVQSNAALANTGIGMSAKSRLREFVQHPISRLQRMSGITGRTAAGADGDQRQVRAGPSCRDCRRVQPEQRRLGAPSRHAVPQRSAITSSSETCLSPGSRGSWRRICKCMVFSND